MTWQQIVGLLLAIYAAEEQLKTLQPGEEAVIDTPDVAFKKGKIRYDITKLVVKRAE